METVYVLMPSTVCWSLRLGPADFVGVMGVRAKIVRMKQREKEYEIRER